MYLVLQIHFVDVADFTLARLASRPSGCRDLRLIAEFTDPLGLLTQSHSLLESQDTEFNFRALPLWNGARGRGLEYKVRYVHLIMMLRLSLMLGCR